MLNLLINSVGVTITNVEAVYELSTNPAATESPGVKNKLGMYVGIGAVVGALLLVRIISAAVAFGKKQ